jgi:hypothetical protein
MLQEQIDNQEYDGIMCLNFDNEKNMSPTRNPKFCNRY